MFNNSFFQELSSRLSSLLPLADQAREELRTKIEQVLKNSFASLDLLTREEFDAQRQALQRAERRIAELEETLAGLDAKLAEIEDRSASD